VFLLVWWVSQQPNLENYGKEDETVLICVMGGLKHIARPNTNNGNEKHKTMLMLAYASVAGKRH
jgi:hypothetical protein